MYDRPSTLKDYDLFFFDSETGGLSAAEADMVEIAIIRTDPTGKNIIEEFEARVFPKKPVHPKAAEVNGYTAEKWAASAVELDTVMHKILSLSKNAIMTGHNVGFDWNFLEAALVKRMMRWNSDYHKYDTVAMATPLLRHGLVPNLKLVTLAKFFGIEHAKAHTAMADIRATRELYLKLNEIIDPTFARYAREVSEKMVGRSEG